MKKKKEIRHLKKQLAQVQQQAHELANRPPETTAKDETWKRQKSYAKNNLAPFAPIAPLRDMITMETAERNNTQCQKDIFDRLGIVGKEAYDLFIDLKLHRHTATNIINYSTIGYTKTQKETFSRKLSKLKVQDIVKRIMIGQYMFNPHLIKCIEQDAALKRWDQ